jgi:hypothetical protein
MAIRIKAPTKTIFLIRHDPSKETTSYIKREEETGYDLRVDDFGDKQFMIMRSLSSLEPISSLKSSGYVECKEDDYNNVLIEVARWLLSLERRKARKKAVTL